MPRALAQIFIENNDHISSFPYIKVNNDQVSILDDEKVEAEVDALREILMASRKISKTQKNADNWLEAIKTEHEFIPKMITTETTHRKLHIWVSFVEIYNEKVIDLLKLPSKSGANPPSLRIISNNRNSFVLGLTWLHVSNLEDALELLQFGLRRVNYAATGLNSHSSRSHTIFTINLVSWHEI